MITLGFCNAHSRLSDALEPAESPLLHWPLPRGPTLTAAFVPSKNDDRILLQTLFFFFFSLLKSERLIKVCRCHNYNNKSLISHCRYRRADDGRTRRACLLIGAKSRGNKDEPQTTLAANAESHEEVLMAAHTNCFSALKSPHDGLRPKKPSKSPFLSSPLNRRHFSTAGG